MFAYQLLTFKYVQGTERRMLTAITQLVYIYRPWRDGRLSWLMSRRYTWNAELARKVSDV